MKINDELVKVSKAIKAEQYVLYSDFKVQYEKCPRCYRLNLKVYMVRNCIWEIWAKCNSCEYIFCIQTE